MTTFTLAHVLLSLAGIGSGFIVVVGMLAAKRMAGSTMFFLATTMATSLTGFRSERIKADLDNSSSPMRDSSPIWANAAYLVSHTHLFC